MNEGKFYPILGPLKSLLFSRKFLIAVAGVVVVLLAEGGLSESALDLVSKILFVLVGSIAVEDGLSSR